MDLKRSHTFLPNTSMTKEEKHVKMPYVFGSSTPRDFSYLDQNIPAKYRMYNIHIKSSPRKDEFDQPQMSLKDFLREVRRSVSPAHGRRDRSLDSAAAGAGRVFVFGSSTPREWSYWERVPHEFRVVDAKFCANQLTTPPLGHEKRSKTAPEVAKTSCIPKNTATPSADGACIALASKHAYNAKAARLDYIRCSSSRSSSSNENVVNPSPAKVRFETEPPKESEGTGRMRGRSARPRSVPANARRPMQQAQERISREISKKSEEITARLSRNGPHRKIDTAVKSIPNQSPLKLQAVRPKSKTDQHANFERSTKNTVHSTKAQPELTINGTEATVKKNSDDGHAFAYGEDNYNENSENIFNKQSLEAVKGQSSTELTAILHESSQIQEDHEQLRPSDQIMDDAEPNYVKTGGHALESSEQRLENDRPQKIENWSSEIFTPVDDSHCTPNTHFASEFASKTSIVAVKENFDSSISSTIKSINDVIENDFQPEIEPDMISHQNDREYDEIHGLDKNENSGPSFFAGSHEEGLIYHEEGVSHSPINAALLKKDSDSNLAVNHFKYSEAHEQQEIGEISSSSELFGDFMLKHAEKFQSEPQHAENLEFEPPDKDFNEKIFLPTFADHFNDNNKEFWPEIYTEENVHNNTPVSLNFEHHNSMLNQTIKGINEIGSLMQKGTHGKNPDFNEIQAKNLKSTEISHDPDVSVDGSGKISLEPLEHSPGVDNESSDCELQHFTKSNKIEEAEVYCDDKNNSVKASSTEHNSQSQLDTFTLEKDSDANLTAPYPLMYHNTSTSRSGSQDSIASPNLLIGRMAENSAAVSCELDAKETVSNEKSHANYEHVDSPGYEKTLTGQFNKSDSPKQKIISEDLPWQGIKFQNVDGQHEIKAEQEDAKIHTDALNNFLENTMPSKTTFSMEDHENYINFEENFTETSEIHKNSQHANEKQATTPSPEHVNRLNLENNTGSVEIPHLNNVKNETPQDAPDFDTKSTSSTEVLNQSPTEKSSFAALSNTGISSEFDLGEISPEPGALKSVIYPSFQEHEIIHPDEMDAKNDGNFDIEASEPEEATFSTVLNSHAPDPHKTSMVEQYASNAAESLLDELMAVNSEDLLRENTLNLMFEHPMKNFTSHITANDNPKIEIHSLQHGPDLLLVADPELQRNPNPWIVDQETVIETTDSLYCDETKLEELSFSQETEKSSHEESYIVENSQAIEESDIFTGRSWQTPVKLDTRPNMQAVPELMNKTTILSHGSTEIKAKSSETNENLEVDPCEFSEKYAAAVPDSHDTNVFTASFTMNTDPLNNAQDEIHNNVTEGSQFDLNPKSSNPIELISIDAQHLKQMKHPPYATENVFKINENFTSAEDKNFSVAMLKHSNQSVEESNASEIIITTLVFNIGLSKNSLNDRQAFSAEFDVKPILQEDSMNRAEDHTTIEEVQLAFEEDRLVPLQTTCDSFDFSVTSSRVSQDGTDADTEVGTSLKAGNQCPVSNLDHITTISQEITAFDHADIFHKQDIDSFYNKLDEKYRIDNDICNANAVHGDSTCEIALSEHSLENKVFSGDGEKYYGRVVKISETGPPGAKWLEGSYTANYDSNVASEKGNILAAIESDDMLVTLANSAIEEGVKSLLLDSAQFNFTSLCENLTAASDNNRAQAYLVKRMSSSSSQSETSETYHTEIEELSHNSTSGTHFSNGRQHSFDNDFFSVGKLTKNNELLENYDFYANSMNNNIEGASFHTKNVKWPNGGALDDFHSPSEVVYHSGIDFSHENFMDSDHTLKAPTKAAVPESQIHTSLSAFEKSSSVQL